jgi:peroxiredoxin
MQMKRALFGIVTVSVAVVALLLIQASLVGAEGAKKAELGSAPPGFELKDVFGKAFKLSDFKDKIIVLEWINQECPVSLGKHENGTMQKTYKKYAAKDVVWVAIDSTYKNGKGKERTPEQNRVYAAEKGLAYPILHDSDGKVGHSYGAKTTPHMFVIDKNGNLAYDGAIDNKGETNYVAAAIDSLLAGKPVEQSKTTPYGCTVKYKM